MGLGNSSDNQDLMSKPQTYEYDPSHDDDQVRLYLLRNYYAVVQSGNEPADGDAFDVYVEAASADGREKLVKKVLEDIRATTNRAKKPVPA